MPPQQDPYDSVAYPGFPYRDTHPDRLATMALLHGLTPAPVSHCRVLDIGCSEGANLIPMAYAIPAGEFVGFDLAAQPVARGQKRIAELGLKNVRLFQANLMDIGAELGEFDYIIAHGFYAWVPEPVRDRMLALCSQLLALNGVAFVSYNAMPGGHLRTMLREMMLFHAGTIEDGAERVSESLGFLEFIAAARPESDPFRSVLEEQLAIMKKRSPHVTFHDELAGSYHPILFTDFAEHAAQHGLQYLSEAVLPPPTDPYYSAEARANLQSVAPDDLIRQEQMLDFMRARMYRETLLCRADQFIHRDYSADRFRKLMLASPATSSPSKSAGSRIFTLPGGIQMESNHAGVIALLERLEARWPRAASVVELEPLLAHAGLVFDDRGVTLLMRLVVTKFVELHAWRPTLAEGLSAHPRASSCARLDARDSGFATTLLHEVFPLQDPVLRCMLGILDGSHDRSALSKAMATRFPEMEAAEIAEQIDTGLALFQRRGLLEA